MPTSPSSPPPFAPAKPKPKPQHKGGHFNSFEMLRDQAQEAGKTIAEVPKAIAQESVDMMWSALLGSSAVNPLEKPREDPSKAEQREKDNRDSFTRLNLEKLNAAYARNDQRAAQQIRERLEEHQQQKQEDAARHGAWRAEIERAIEEMKLEREQKKKQELEEEQMKKRQEEEVAAANAQMLDAGAGKKKTGIGQARPKAQVETNFEAGKGRTGR
ncbi:MAG: hypothetical protein N2691_04240 [Patescibacteria group bacterium]|nr:hypothetical protein [Patescibacteria group bacterium]